MKKLSLALLVCLSVAGCATYKTLPAQGPADFVEITTLGGRPKLAKKEIREKERIEALVAFVNALPNKWGVPWYGPPVGAVSFTFYSDGKFCGHFHVGPVFFGRENFSSQATSQKKIEELGGIVDIDLWGYITAKKFNQ
jgi:hypothetical protein